MRVLLVSWEYPPVIEGGLGRHVRKLSEHLVRDGVEVHVLTRGGGRLPAEEERHGVIVHRVREPPFPKDVSAFVRWVEAMNGDMRALGDELCERFEFDARALARLARRRRRGAAARARSSGRGSRPSTPPSTAATRAGCRTILSRTSTRSSGRWCAAPTT